MTTDDLPAVTEIHRRAFPASAMTRLGAGSVRRYYTWLLTGPHDVHAVVCEIGGAPMGFLVGGRFRGAMTGFLQRNVVYLAAQVLARPRLWRQARLRERAVLARRLLLAGRNARPTVTPAQAVTDTQHSFGVLVIAVDPSARRQGAGRALMESATREARARGASHMHLSVESENAGAIRFYEGLGWQPRGETFTGSMILHLGASPTA